MTGQTALPADHSVLWAFFDEYCARLRRWEPRYLNDLDAVPDVMMDDLAESVAALCVAACRLEVKNDAPTRLRKRTLSGALFVEANKIDRAALWSPARELPGLALLARLVREFAARAAVPEDRTRRGRPSGGFSSPAGAAVQAVVDAFQATGNSGGLADVIAEGAAPNDDGCDGRRSEGVAALMSALAPELRAAGISEADLAKAIRNVRSKLKKSRA
jgi:hypothetical protein